MFLGFFLCFFFSLPYFNLPFKQLFFPFCTFQLFLSYQQSIFSNKQKNLSTLLLFNIFLSSFTYIKLPLLFLLNFTSVPFVFLFFFFFFFLLLLSLLFTKYYLFSSVSLLLPLLCSSFFYRHASGLCLQSPFWSVLSQTCLEDSHLFQSTFTMEGGGH